jgi:hypothetical protein
LLLTRPALALAVVVVVAAMAMAMPARAQRSSTSDALARAEESISLRMEEGTLRKEDLAPAVLVSARGAYAETQASYPTEALSSLVRVLGPGSLRSCEACMQPRVYAADGRLEYDSGDPTLEEIAHLDEMHRGADPPAKTAIWLDETASGVALRIVALGSSRILYAENFDALLSDKARTTRNISRAAELERRQRGEALVHTFIDVGVLPQQHLSLDWAEQFGDQNQNLAGVSFSVFDPVIGVGGAYYRIIPQAFGIAVGAKLLVSLPTALVQIVSQGANNGGATQLIDPLLTGVAVVRIPVFDTNYGLLLTASTNFRFTIGISLLNFSLLPLFP